MVVGPIQLLILQASPFCNINCRYCYLPNRQSKQRISCDIVRKAVERAVEDGLFSDRVSIVWHAGEPLAVPISFYQEAIAVIREVLPSSVTATHVFQTNGTLIDQEWCAFFRSINARIGISLDGPKEIHDSARVTRGGDGTFDKTLRGLKLLQQTNVEHYVLSVLTDVSLGRPHEMYDFFREAGVQDLGFNVEEVEGANKNSSLEGAGSDKFASFVSTFYDRCISADAPKLSVREFRQLEGFLLNADLSNERHTQQQTPYKIICVDHDGNFSTFSPELLGIKGGPAGDFLLGNVRTDSFRSALQGEKFASIFSEIVRGQDRCRESCSYFAICGGGSPSNKLSENGSMASTETLFCELRVKRLSEVILKKLEDQVVHRQS